MAIPTWAVKPSNTPRSSTETPANDPDLVLPLASNAVYSLELILLYDGTTAGDFAGHFHGPTGMTMANIVLGITPSGASNFDDVTVGTSGTSFNIGALGAGTTCGALVKGTVTTSSTAGNLTLQWAQVSSSGTATILHSGSSMRLERSG